MDILFIIATLFVMSIYFQVIANRDKKHRRMQREYVRLKQKEERRLAVNTKLTPVRHQGVLYLDDYRRSLAK